MGLVLVLVRRYLIAVAVTRCTLLSSPGFSGFSFLQERDVTLCCQEHSDVEEPSLNGDGFSLNFSKKTTISTRMLSEEAPLIKEVTRKTN